MSFSERKVIEIVCEICLSCVYNNNTIIYFLQDQTSYTKPELSEEEKHR